MNRVLIIHFHFVWQRNAKSKYAQKNNYDIQTKTYDKIATALLYAYYTLTFDAKLLILATVRLYFL